MFSTTGHFITSGKGILNLELGFKFQKKIVSKHAFFSFILIIQVTCQFTYNLAKIKYFLTKRRSQFSRKIQFLCIFYISYVQKITSRVCYVFNGVN